jgi:uncharacterized protein
MGLHEIEKLLLNKSNGHQIEEAVRKWEKNLASYTSDKRLITRLYKDLKKVNSKKQRKSVTQ